MLLLGSLVFGVVALVFVGMGLARGGDSLLYGNALRVPMQVSTDDLGALPPALAWGSSAEVTVEVRDPTVQQVLLQSARDLGPLAISIGALRLVRGVLHAVTRHDLFGDPNVRRLHNLGALLAVGAPLAALLDTQLRPALFNQLPPQPSVHLGVPGYALPGGVMLGG